MEELCGKLTYLLEENEKTAVFLYQRKTVEGLQHFVEKFTESISIITRVVMLGVERPDIAVCQERLLSAMELLEQLVDGKDVVLLADILIHEINDELQSVLEQLR